MRNLNRTSTALMAMALLATTGCQTAGKPLAWLPWNRGMSQEEAIQSQLAGQPSQARQANAGGQSSLYPPAVIQQEPLPKTEKDLKNPLQLHLSYAKFQEQIGHLTEARQSYERVVESEPKSVEANIGLARLDALAGRTEEAEARFRMATSLEPLNSEGYFAFGQFLSSQKRPTEAIAEYQKALKYRPGSQEYKYALGIELARIGQYDQSLEMLSEVIDRAEALYNIGYVVMTEQGDDAVAEKLMAESLKLNPNLKPARYWVAELKSKHNAPTNQQQILTASADQQQAKAPIIHAVAAQPANQPPGRSVMPASVPPGHHPEKLTPEQWEQWNNQIKSK